MHEQILARISACEQENARLVKRLKFQNLTFALLGLVCVGSTAIASFTPDKINNTYDSLRVKELVVVDQQGVVRTRVGGDLPPAVIKGKTLTRGGATHSGVAGVMLYDKDGIERGGYVTFDKGGNVALTLDTQEKQMVFFGVGPNGGAALQMWSDKNALDLRADDDGARFSSIQNAVVTNQIPELKIQADTCADYKSGLKSESDKPLDFATMKKYAKSASALNNVYLVCPKCTNQEKIMRRRGRRENLKTETM